MATVIHEHFETPLEGLRISWGGVWAGALTVVGTLLFLSILGLAVGVSAVDPRSTDAGELGAGAAFWTGFSLLIALFVGGMAATRLGMVFDKATGAFEGVLVWVLSFVAILWLASSGVRLIAGGAADLFGGVTQSVGSVAANMDDLSRGDVDQVLARLKDPGTASTIARLTGMSEQEVSSDLQGIAQRVEAARDNPEQVATEVRNGAQQLLARARQELPAAAERAQTGVMKTAWSTFTAMLVSLVAAIGGAMLGRRRAIRRLARETTEETFDTGAARTR